MFFQYCIYQAAKLPPPSKDNVDLAKENATENVIDEGKDDLEGKDYDGNKMIFSEVWSPEEIESSFIAHEEFRISSELREKINFVLQKFVGSHYYHNYTSGK